ncbi:DUF433 domain-containing protein [Actinomadura litoris]|uniref:DUF433 domain-containing protein n=1 Tax=Actinomadura litoris TaxID=2678616 RepID=A0A7K1LAH6_9ACTN|nr:DUF433 domain-containing protein [Actinomadura litoris]MUN41430.1 DUF433 domain-containing protein [Actinomadura litoris]
MSPKIRVTLDAGSGEIKELLTVETVDDGALDSVAPVTDDEDALMAHLASALRAAAEMLEGDSSTPTTPWGCDWPRPVIHVDPAVRSGQPMIRGISCAAIADRVHAGDAPEDVALDYGVTRTEVLLACWWAGLNGRPYIRRRFAAWAKNAHQLIARGEYDQVPDPPARPERT